jgi:hypothetical protein
MLMRRQTVEHSFGTIKQTRAERVTIGVSLHALAYDLKLMITSLELCPEVGDGVTG